MESLKTIRLGALLALPLFLGAILAPTCSPGAIRWRKLEEGLELARFSLPGEHKPERDWVTVVRADPAHFNLQVAEARLEPDRRPRTPAEWCRLKQSQAAINASMYLPDGLTSLGLLRTPRGNNNSALRRDQCVLVAEPVDPGLARAQVLELDSPGARALLPRYRTAIQNIRMVASRPVPHVVWNNKSGSWSQAAVGMDEGGRLLLVYSSGSRNPGALAQGLLALPLGLRVLMHTEGGEEAGLCVRAGGLDTEWNVSGAVRSFESSEKHPHARVPNVLLLLRNSH